MIFWGDRREKKLGRQVNAGYVTGRPAAQDDHGPNCTADRKTTVPNLGSDLAAPRETHWYEGRRDFCRGDTVRAVQPILKTAIFASPIGDFGGAIRERRNLQR